MIYLPVRQLIERRVCRLIGTNVKILREIRGISQKELAELANISTGNISHIENGSRQPSLETLYKIADALNVSILNLVLDEKEIERFLYNDVIKAYYPGSTRLKDILGQIIENGVAWDNAKRIAIVDLDDITKK